MKKVIQRGANISTQIFNESKKQHEPDTNFKNANINTDNLNIIEGGAFASLRKKMANQVSNRDAGYKKKEEKPIKEETSVKVKINVQDYINNLLDSLVTLSTGGDYTSVLKNLWSLYLIGELDNYEITGYDAEIKKEILAIIDEFKSTVENILI